MAPIPKLMNPQRTAHDNDNDADFGINLQIRPAFPFIGGESLDIPRYLIKGVMPESGVVVLGGQSRGGKSLIAGEISLSLIYGRHFLDNRVKRGGVLWIAAEGYDEVRSRISVARKMHFRDSSNSPIPFQLPKLAEIETSATTTPDTNAILVELESMIRAASGSFAETCPRNPLRLVVIDTLSAFFNLTEENSNAEAARLMRRLGDIAARWGVVILVIHHFGKGAETGLRGASAFTAGADAIVVCKASIDEQTGLDIGPRTLALTKTRRGTPGPLAGYSVKSAVIGEDEDGDEASAPYVEFNDKPVNIAHKSKPPSRAMQCFYSALDEIIATNGVEHRFHGDGPIVRAAPRELVRREFARRYVEDGTGKAGSSERTAWSRAFDGATGAGTVAGEQFNQATALIWRV